MSFQTKGVINNCQQIQYLSQWFSEFSELQKNDFMSYLTNKYSINKQTEELLINGFNDLSVGERPASIFQCRMKLFNEWFVQWSDEEKQELLIRLRNIDSEFMAQFQTIIETNANSIVKNGIEVNDKPFDDSIDDKLINGNIEDDLKGGHKLVEDQEVIAVEVKVNGVSNEDIIDDKSEDIDEDINEEQTPIDPELKPTVVETEEVVVVSSEVVEVVNEDKEVVVKDEIIEESVNE